MSQPIPVITRSFRVSASEQQAFDAFTRDFIKWWPSQYTWSGDKLVAIGFEPRQGGRCFERDSDGAERDWGRVFVWEAPRRIVFTWQIAPDWAPETDPEKASEVEVRFTAETPERTRVELEHRNFHRHGEGAEAYRASLDATDGWTQVLERYVELVSR